MSLDAQELGSKSEHLVMRSNESHVSNLLVLDRSSMATLFSSTQLTISGARKQFLSYMGLQKLNQVKYTKN